MGRYGYDRVGWDWVGQEGVGIKYDSIGGIVGVW